MGVFLDSAYEVLKKEGVPLGTKELTDIAIKSGILKTTGKTPHQTMKSKISTNILKYKDKSLFKRAEAGKFALREWKTIKEYISPRYKKALFDEEILVFKKEHLSQFVDKNGVTAKINRFSDLVSQLNRVLISVKRSDAENNYDLIQLISVFIVKYGDLYLTHKRTKRLPESRLHDFYSIMFGGHLNPNDLLPVLNDLDIKREFKEELKLTYEPNIEYRGLLYDDSREVSKIHLGIVCDVPLKNMEYEIGERGFLMDPKFETIDQIKDRIDDFENWSHLIVKGGY